MMDTEILLRLTADSGIAAIAGAQIYPASAPKEAVGSYVIWNRLSDVPAQGALDGESDIVASRVQIDSYGDNYTSARALADAVRRALRDWKASDGIIRDVILDNSRNVRDADPALKTYRVSQDYIVTFVE